MRCFEHKIWKEDEYDYKAAYGFRPDIHAYIHDEDTTDRDCMLVVPGGGYCMCAPHEGEPVARTFFDMGMNTFVLTYTTDQTMSVPLHKQPLNDISRAVRYLRKNSSEFHISNKKLILCGFSAGAHLCGSLAVHYLDISDPDISYNENSNRPDGVILSYPVITTGEYTHIYSVYSLCGFHPSEEELHYFSIEKNVVNDTPPCFLWQTATDDAVPVENSYLMAMALKKHNIPFAHYVYPEGWHGVGLCNSDYFNHAGTGEYVMDQYHRVVDAVRNGNTVSVSKERINELLTQFKYEEETYEKQILESKLSDKTDDPYIQRLISSISTWPGLAYDWIESIG